MHESESWSINTLNKLVPVSETNVKFFLYLALVVSVSLSRANTTRESDGSDPCEYVPHTTGACGPLLLRVRNDAGVMGLSRLCRIGGFSQGNRTEQNSQGPRLT